MRIFCPLSDPGRTLGLQGLSVSWVWPSEWAGRSEPQEALDRKCFPGHLWRRLEGRFPGTMQKAVVLRVYTPCHPSVTGNHRTPGLVVTVLTSQSCSRRPHLAPRQAWRLHLSTIMSILLPPPCLCSVLNCHPSSGQRHTVPPRGQEVMRGARQMQQLPQPTGPGQ